MTITEGWRRKDLCLSWRHRETGLHEEVRRGRRGSEGKAMGAAGPEPRARRGPEWVGQGHMREATN